MGRAKGRMQRAGAQAPARRHTIDEAAGFGAVFGDQRGTTAEHRCAACGTRAELTPQPDNRRLCGECAAKADEARTFAELDTRLRALAEPLLANLGEATMEQRVAAYEASETAVREELEILLADRRRLSGLIPEADHNDELRRLDRLIAHAKAYLPKVSIQTLSQKNENK